MLMRETASELTLDGGAFDRERGVILSEERSRDTPQYRAALGITNSLLAGQRATMRAPIGKTDIISNAPVELLREYYWANYRPERATLIVVGDIDPAAMEIEIRQRFGDWKAVGPPPAEPDPGTLETKGESADVFVVPGGMTSVRIAWTRPYDAAPDTFAKRRTKLIEDLGLRVLETGCNEPLFILLRPAPSALDRRDHFNLMLRHRTTPSVCTRTSARKMASPHAYVAIPDLVLSQTRRIVQVTSDVMI
jgi:zinc protease